MGFWEILGHSLREVHYMSKGRLTQVLEGRWEIKMDMDLYLLNWINQLEVNE
jgi:hypothetical protein